MLDATTKPVPDLAGRPRLLVALWVGATVVVAISGVLSRAPQLAPVALLGTVAAWTLAYRRLADVRAWADAVPTRALLALHAVRLPIGALFIWEAARGQLAPLFADRAGYGDIAVGAIAIVVAGIAWRSRRTVVVFTLVGLADILVAVGTAMYLIFAVRDPLMLGAFARMPYPLLPLLIVPAVVLTHLLVLRRSTASSRVA